MGREAMNEPKIVVEMCRKMSAGLSFSDQGLYDDDVDGLHPLRASGSVTGSKYSLPFPSDTIGRRDRDHRGRRRGTGGDRRSYDISLLQARSSSSHSVSNRVPDTFFRSLTQGASTPNLVNVSSKGKKVLGIPDNLLGQSSNYYLNVPLKTAKSYASKSTSELENIMEEEKSRLLKLKRFDLFDAGTMRCDERKNFKKGWFVKHHLPRKLKKFGSSLQIHKSKKDNLGRGGGSGDDKSETDYESWNYFVERCLFDEPFSGSETGDDDEETKRARRDRNSLKNTIQMIWTRYKLNTTLAYRQTKPPSRK